MLNHLFHTIQVLFVCLLFIVFTVSGKSQSLFNTTSTDLEKEFECAEATCIVFFIEDCPVCQGITHKLIQLRKDYFPDELNLIGVYSIKTDALEGLQNYIDEYPINFPICIDTSLSVAAHFGAKVTPEVFLFDKEGELQYRGAFDDYYYTLGRHRRVVQHHFLKNALAALLAGKTIDVQASKPVGCFIQYEHKYFWQYWK